MTMSDGLTARQTQILKALVDEYISIADPVGSEALEKKYSLGVSPATIRNEMSSLTKMGYLRQPHTSAGRLPTPKAMKFYINQLMDEKQMSLTEEVKAKEEVWDKRNDIEDLLKEATQSLAQRTQSLAISTLDEGDEGKVWHSGYVHVFSNPEFTDLRLTMGLFSFLEEARRMQEIFFQRMTGSSAVEVVFGEDLGWQDLNYLGVVGTRFKAHKHDCGLGVIGTTRQSYSTVVPVLRYYRSLLQEIT
jgi:transcriptional regulator of heat shock response